MTLARFSENLARLADGAQEALAAALAASAASVCAAARACAPVDTGRLRDGIAREYTQDGARVLSAAPYSVAVELGTLSRPAQPFLLPAFTAHADDHRAAMRAYLREVM